MREKDSSLRALRATRPHTVSYIGGCDQEQGVMECPRCVRDCARRGRGEPATTLSSTRIHWRQSFFAADGDAAQRLSTLGKFSRRMSKNDPCEVRCVVGGCRGASAETREKNPNLSLKSKSETLKAKSNTQTLNRPQAGFMCLIYSEFSIQSCPKTFYGHFELELWETQ